MVTVFVPLKNAASNFTDMLFPHSVHKSSITRDLEIYRKQLEGVWKDETITEKERMLLNTLKSSLDISEEDAERLEREVLGDRDQN